MNVRPKLIFATNNVGRDPKSLESALLDTGKAVGNGVVNLVEGSVNFVLGGGSLPGEIGYANFLHFAKPSSYSSYDTPFFGESVEFLTSLGAAKLLGAISSANRVVAEEASVPHGNSNASSSAQHGYEIVDTHNGTVAKTGISGQTLNKNGTSPRANSQANKWNKEEGNQGRYDPQLKVNFPAGRGARQAAKQWEAQNAAELRNQGQLDPARHTTP
jgi:hypothetical protein